MSNLSPLTVMEEPIITTQSPQGDVRPSNYLVWSILTAVFCCTPISIPAIVFSANVNSRWSRGDYQGAVDASRKAKMWIWISFGVGLTVWVAYLFLCVIGAMM